MAKLARIFGAQVKAARMRRGLTQVQLADAVGVSEQWIRKIEAGEASPSFDTIEGLGRALATPIGDLFEEGRVSSVGEAITVAAEPLKADEIEWLLAGARLLSRARAD